MDDLKRALVITALTCALLAASALADTDAPAAPAPPDTQDTVNVQDTQAAPDTQATQASQAMPVMPAAPGKKAAPADDRSDKVPHRYPLVSMACSAVFPGGGQLYTQKYFRAAAFAGTLGYLGYRYYKEDKLMNREFDLAVRTGNSNSPEFILHAENYYAHYDNRRTFQWWFVGIWLFSLADAYVDAHMFKFDERAEPKLSLQATPASLSLSAKF
ncbi:MAG: DUF5683 domain-containing protein [Candidatus Edwardsbacteria bacterium]|nr:DUF5683 domain-containing protein [Candidatus Edwardsbacteria bacterium]